ncbi:RNA-directed DNA polymerase from mobile element jockey-like [Elysia marginata]|uniref:RNA-directed DNA polymerase from mobile element jockey-like n=1 Tax=Elysia marginata TaxID=1093978 RepID=A0AAV4IHQ9_9GAST|nr:RNA-directed DNA polymerase from mobile element jockey-like [Elysia marginata]
MSVQQARFRPQRGTTEQVLAFTPHVEAGFEKKLKTGAILIDLSAVYDTVWTGGLMLKVTNLIPCKKILKILSVMTGFKQFHVMLRGEKSKTRKIRKGMPQGSVVAPTLFNFYISDMSETNSQLAYADDWVLTHQSKEWTEIEDTLSKDTTALKGYFDTWYLKMKTTKSVSTTFHLNNHEALKTLIFKVKNKILPSNPSPKY